MRRLMQAAARTVSSPHAGAALLAAVALLALVLPLPGFVVDLLLALSMGAAVGALLVALAAPDPGRLTSLPPALVLASLARIVLCLCVSRLILVTGEGSPLVLTLGRALSGSDPVAGIGLLVVLAVVQLVMITAGVGRMSEVAARFALDAMPGKQMGLDTALGRGQVSAEEAREQVRRLEQEANFYGALDGAGRLLRGEAVATVAVVALTAIAAAARALGGTTPAAEVAGHYATLATGQGMVIILPALLAGAATAVVVVRSASGSALLEELGGQKLLGAWPLGAAAAALLVVGLLPGVAKAPMLVSALALGGAAWWAASRGERAESRWRGSLSADRAGELTVEVGMGLLDLVDGPEGLATQLGSLRSEVSAEVGFALPAATIRDSIDLRATEYLLALRGIEVARGIVRPQRLLAVPPTAGVMPDVGRPGELGDGRIGVWVTEDEARALSSMDYQLMTPAQAILEHLRLALRRNAAELFDLELAARMLREMTASHPELMGEARGAGLTAPLLRQVCDRLLEAGVPLRDPVPVVEALAEGLPGTSDPEELALLCRRRLARAIAAQVAPHGRLRALGLADELQDELAESAHRPADRTVAALSPERGAAWVKALGEAAREHGWGRPLALLCSQRCLLPLMHLCSQIKPELIPLAPGELPPSVSVEFVARLDPEHLS